MGRNKEETPIEKLVRYRIDHLAQLQEVMGESCARLTRPNPALTEVEIAELIGKLKFQQTLIEYAADSFYGDAAQIGEEMEEYFNQKIQ